MQKIKPAAQHISFPFGPWHHKTIVIVSFNQTVYSVTPNRSPCTLGSTSAVTREYVK